jgi:hypothetical protein
VGARSINSRRSAAPQFPEITDDKQARRKLLGGIDEIYVRFRALQVVHDASRWLGKTTPTRADEPTYSRLEVSGEAFATDPRDLAIAAAVSAAAAKANGEAFLVLDSAHDTFIQAAVTKGGWNLEFKAVSLDRSGSSPIIFGCRKPVRRQIVIRAFQLYRADDDRWTESCAWTRIA